MVNSVADFNNDDWLSSEVTHDSANGVVVIRLRAKKAIRILEVQGFATDVEAFGLSMPQGFRKMLFGEGANIPDEMKSDIEHMNRLNFRWGCDLPMNPGSELEIKIPAAGQGKDRVVFTLSYEYPKLFGLLKAKQGLYARMTPD